MIQLAISVEGATEEEFVNRVLAEHLRTSGVDPQPFLVNYRGGSVSIDRLASDMAKLYWRWDYVTSLVDFYGFKDKDEATPGELEKRLDEAIDRKIQRSWDQSRVFSYVQRHEFEGLLFSDVSAFASLVEASGDSIRELKRIRLQFPTPEDINDSHTTAPSKRIVKLIPRYRKRRDGPFLAGKIGLDKIRTECPRFDKWVTRLESLRSTGAENS